MITKYYEYIGKAIRNARKLHNMTQQEVADRLGIKRSLYSQYERGACSISLKTAIEYSVEPSMVRLCGDNSPNIKKPRR